MMQKFSDPLRLLILTGSTGSGKTEILRGLSSSGEQIIDLEELACHKGSVFGGLGQDKQPSTEQFQNYLFKNLSELDLTKRIWVEDESIGIGEVYIPHEFWEQMKSSPIIRIELGKAERINRLVHEYGLFPVSQLEEQIKKIVSVLVDWKPKMYSINCKKEISKRQHGSFLDIMTKPMTIQLKGKVQNLYVH